MRRGGEEISEAGDSHLARAANVYPITAARGSIEFTLGRAQLHTLRDSGIHNRREASDKAVRNAERRHKRSEQR